MSAIPDDVMWWIKKDPNFSRLQAAICRRELILGQDEILKIDQKVESSEPQNGKSSS